MKYLVLRYFVTAIENELKYIQTKFRHIMNIHCLNEDFPQWENGIAVILLMTYFDARFKVAICELPPL